jgi:hypothetical protein
MTIPIEYVFMNIIHPVEFLDAVFEHTEKYGSNTTWEAILMPFCKLQILWS